MAFNKGYIPWNKGLKYNEEKKGRMNLSGLIFGRTWKTKKLLIPSYQNIHYWVRKNKGKPVVCEMCGIGGKRLEWSNIDHKYKHSLDDYVALCKKCHTRYDYDNHLSDKGSRGGSIPNKKEVI